MSKKSQIRVLKTLSYFIFFIVIPVLLFLFLELSLHLIGYGKSVKYYEEINYHGKEYFVLNPYFVKQYFPSSSVRQSAHFMIPAEKGKNTYRIFILGGSAAMGDPDPSFSFSVMLHAMLKHAYPHIQFEVINTAMTAINSHVVGQIAKDCAEMEPDLFIAYLGNNEVVGPFGPTAVLTPYFYNSFLLKLTKQYRKTRIYQLISNIQFALKKNQENSGWQGMEMFLDHELRKTDKQMASVYDNFEDNLKSICQSSKGNDSELLICEVFANEKDCSPFLSLHNENLSETNKTKFEGFIKKGDGLYSSRQFGEAIEQYRQALAIDSTFANTLFKVGKCYELLNKLDTARKYYEKSIDYDCLRFRIDSELKRRTLAVARKYIDEILTLPEKDIIGNTIPGKEHLWEHVHLNFHGNYLIAKNIFEKIGNIQEGIFQHPTIMENGNSLLDEDSLKVLLAYTPYHEHEIVYGIINRLTNPPFSNQISSAFEYSRLKEKLETLSDYNSLSNQKEIIETFEIASEFWKNRGKTVLFNYAMYMIDMVEDYEMGKILTERYIKLFPLDFINAAQLGKVYIQLGNKERAFELWKKALNIYPYFWPGYYYFAYQYLNDGNIDMAEKYIQNALRYNKNESFLWIFYAKIHFLRNNYKKAMEICQDILQRDKNAKNANEIVGDIHYRSGDYADAVRYYMKEIKIEPTSPLLNRLGDIFFGAKRYEEALYFYQRSIELNQNQKKIHEQIDLLNNLNDGG